MCSKRLTETEHFYDWHRVTTLLVLTMQNVERAADRLLFDDDFERGVKPLSR